MLSAGVVCTATRAGWPEAAMAGALGLRLAGPRAHDGAMVDDKNDIATKEKFKDFQLHVEFNEPKLGPEFKPSAMLRRLAAERKQFTGAA